MYNETNETVGYCHIVNLPLLYIYKHSFLVHVQK